MLNGMVLFKRFCDNVWEYNSTTNEVYIYHNNRIPELCGQSYEYESFHVMYQEQFICSEDVNLWQYYMSSQSLRNFLKSGKEEEHFFIHTKHGKAATEWHEAFIEKRNDTTLLIGSVDINKAKRDVSIAKAVLPEFDYVCRINISTGSYVLYYSDTVRGAIPPLESDNYNETMTAFNKKVVTLRNIEEFCDKMKIENVVKQLESMDEYTLYATSKNKDGLAHKKLRFCYADDQKKELLLTRIDVSGLVEERKKRELEEQKRIKYLENMPIGFSSAEVLLNESGAPIDFRYTYCNYAHEKMAGVERGQLLGKRFYEFFDNADPDWLTYYYETAYEGKSHYFKKYSPEIGKELLVHTFQVEEGHCERVMMDITKEIFLTSELQKSREVVQRILETTTDLVFQYYPQTREISFNELGREWGYDQFPDKEILHKLTESGYLDSSYVELILHALDEICAGKNNVSVVIRARKSTDTPWLWYKIVLFDYSDEYTLERKVLGYLQNVNYDMIERAELRAKAQTDSLTQLLNVKTGQEKIEEILKKQNKTGIKNNIMYLMDLDDFKKINDTMGHMAGDDVLKCFAQVLRETFPAEHIIYRLGGDEFAVFTEDIADYKSEIPSVMKRFEQNIQKRREKYPLLSASTGIFVSNTTKDFMCYYNETDKALYETKRNGKRHYTVRFSLKDDLE